MDLARSIARERYRFSEGGRVLQILIQHTNIHTKILRKPAVRSTVMLIRSIQKYLVIQQAS